MTYQLRPLHLSIVVVTVLIEVVVEIHAAYLVNVLNR